MTTTCVWGIASHKFLLWFPSKSKLGQIQWYRTLLNSIWRNLAQMLSNLLAVFSLSYVYLKSIQSTLKTSNSYHWSSNLQRVGSSIKTTMCANRATTSSCNATGKLAKKSSPIWTAYVLHSKRCSIKDFLQLIKQLLSKKVKFSNSKGHQRLAQN